MGNPGIVDFSCSSPVGGDLPPGLDRRCNHGAQPSLFRKVGIEPFEAKVVALKSGTGYKVTYGHVATAVLRADCPGAMSYNIENFDFRRVPRPIFPLDREMEWWPYATGDRA